MNSVFNSEIVKKDRLLPGIHGLRGVAALAVVFFHLVHVGKINPPNAFGFIGRDFGISVHLFFI
jgi:peptidoglycan/LPS O-acetylase OafA/YrhL